MNKFGLLTIDQIECRQAKANQQSGVDILLYKTARTDANILDNVIGSENWVNDFKMIGEVLYGGIGIRQENEEWIWKWDAGAESNIEQEKGNASDAFKRAGFKWGIGRELYSSPRIHFKPDEVTWYKEKCYDNFEVQDIGYDDNENICKVVVVDLKSKAVFSYENGKSVVKAGVPKNDRQDEKKDNGEPPIVTEAQRKTLFEIARQLYGEKGTDEVKRAMEVVGLKSTKGIRQDEYAKLMAELKKGA